MKCGKCESPQRLQGVIVTWMFLYSQGKRLMGWMYIPQVPALPPGSYHSSRATSTELKWAKTSIFKAHFSIFSAEEALTLKRSQVTYVRMKHSSCLLLSYYFGLPCIYVPSTAPARAAEFSLLAGIIWAQVMSSSSVALLQALRWELTHGVLPWISWCVLDCLGAVGQQPGQGLTPQHEIQGDTPAGVLGDWTGTTEIKNRYVKVNCAETREGMSWSPDL